MNIKKFSSDGHTTLTLIEHITRGTVLRQIHPSDNDTVSSYSDCTIAAVFYEHKEMQVQLSRPMLSVDDTTYIGYSVHVEVFVVSVARVLANDSVFRTILQATGLPASYRKFNKKPLDCDDKL